MRRIVTRTFVLTACSLVLGACQDDGEKVVEHLSRGSDYQMERNYPAAIIEYKNVLQIDPNNAAAHWGLAKGYLANQQLQEGFWELRETVRLDPDNTDAREQLTQLLLLGGDPDEALVQAEELISRGGERGHLHRANALDRLERTDEALEEYELAIAAAPEESAPVAIYAQALVRPWYGTETARRPSATSGSWSRWPRPSPAIRGSRHFSRRTAPGMTRPSRFSWTRRVSPKATNRFAPIKIWRVSIFSANASTKPPLISRESSRPSRIPYR
jgi:tetratricopeptide (TPR) repeat protein